MRHSWTKGGVTYNFCLKCGVRKSRSYKLKCEHSGFQPPSNIHTFQKKVLYSQYEYFHCTKCGLEANKRYWQNFAVKLFPEALHPVVPYIEIFNAQNKVVRCRFISGAESVLKRYEQDGYEVKFWPIYCAYTDEEASIKQIIE